MVVIRCVFGPSRNLRQLSLLESWLGGGVNSPSVNSLLESWLGGGINSPKVLIISVWMT